MMDEVLPGLASLIIHRTQNTTTHDSSHVTEQMGHNSKLLSLALWGLNYRRELRRGVEGRHNFSCLLQ